MVLLIFLGMPIAFALMLVGASGIWVFAGPDAALPVLASTVYETASTYPFTIIPLFVLMGGFADASGITTRLYRTFDTWFRRWPGGLGIATIVAISGFSAISGSSIATSAAFGKAVIPEMRRYRYAPKFAAGIVAAGATIDFLIPPSIGFVVYGMVTEQSIGKLLIAGILPGLVLAGLFVAIIVIWVKLDPAVAPVPPGIPSWRERVRALAGMWETIVVFLVTIGGMYLGYVNPTEAGGVGLRAAARHHPAAGRALVAAVRGQPARHDPGRPAWCCSSWRGRTSSATSWRSPRSRPRPPRGSPPSASRATSVLGIVILVYLGMGCFLDAVSMMVLTMPVVFPLIVGLGFDPIWFGVICVLMMNAGLITPPIGLNVNTIAGIVRDIPAKDVFLGAMPFLLAIYATTLIIIIWPQIATLLPGYMGR